MYIKSMLLVSIIAVIIIFFEQTKKPAIAQEPPQIVFEKGGAFNG